MKTKEEIQKEILDIKAKLKSSDFNKLSTKEQLFLEAINQSCIATLQWVLNDENII